jgi:hypothetical protein
MEQVSPPPHHLPLILVSALTGVGLVAAAFYGWMQYGSSMLLTLGETGLSTCL